VPRHPLDMNRWCRDTRLAHRDVIVGIDLNLTMQEEFRYASVFRGVDFVRRFGACGL
jgi:hypothetical protein